nr:hypothetical protein [Tanacetum cinerariifolium]
MRKALFEFNGGRCGGNGRRGGSMTRRGSSWLATRSIVSNEGCGSGELAVRGGRSSSESKNGRGDVRGVEKIRSTGSTFIATGEFCLKGCDCADGGEVNRGGVFLGVFKR